jgi:hypothetical protein
MEPAVGRAAVGVVKGAEPEEQVSDLAVVDPAEELVRAVEDLDPVAVGADLARAYLVGVRVEDLDLAPEEVREAADRVDLALDPAQAEAYLVEVRVEDLDLAPEEEVREAADRVDLALDLAEAQDREERAAEVEIPASG